MCRKDIQGLVLIKELALVDPEDCLNITSQRLRALPSLRADLAMYALCWEHVLRLHTLLDGTGYPHLLHMQIQNAVPDTFQHLSPLLQCPLEHAAPHTLLCLPAQA